MLTRVDVRGTCVDTCGVEGLCVVTCGGEGNVC